MADKIIQYTEHEEKWLLRDDNLPVQFVDKILEVRWANGVAYLSLAASVSDEGTMLEARVAFRGRFSLRMAKAIRDGMDQILMKAAEPQKPN